MFSFPGFVSCLLPKKQTRIYYIRNTAKEVSLIPKQHMPKSKLRPSSIVELFRCRTQCKLHCISNNGFFSFVLSSAHEKFDVWTWPTAPTVLRGKLQLITRSWVNSIKKHFTRTLGPLCLQIHTNLNPLKVFRSSP